MKGFGKSLTLRLLAFVTSHGTDDGVLLAGYAVAGTFDVAFSASSVVLGFTLGMLLPASLLPVFRTGDIADLENHL